MRTISLLGRDLTCACAPLLRLSALVGCRGDDDESTVLGEVAALEAEINREVARACAATAADVRAAEREGVRGGSAAACVAELRVEFDACEREALNDHPVEARALLDCVARDRRLLMQCCSGDEECSHERIQQCYDSLWAGEQRGDCQVDTAAIDAARDACHARDQASNFGFRDPCADATFRKIPFAAPTEFGKSPAEALAPYAGSCKAVYRLQSGGSRLKTIPREAQGDLTLEVELDQRSARFVTPSAEGAARGCLRHVEVQMTARVRTSDGVLDERTRGAFSYGEDGLLAPSSSPFATREALFALSIAQGEIAGTLELSSKERGDLSLHLSPRPLADACEGSIWISRIDPGVGGGGSIVGWWSPTGCRPDHEPNSCIPGLPIGSVSLRSSASPSAK